MAKIISSSVKYTVSLDGNNYVKCRDHVSYSKYIERQIIMAWKRITRTTRKTERMSFLPRDFVLVTAARRRSALMV